MEELRAMRDRARSLEWLAAFTDGNVVVDVARDPRIVRAVRIDPELPGSSALPPLLGRTFSSEEPAQVGSADPITYVAVVVVLAGVAILASWVPARRAAAVDVMMALRRD